MYDVMATTRVGQGRRERQARERSRQRDGAETVPEEEWAPDRHRTIPGEEAAELVPALAALDPKEAYLFYDCQTDDVRLVLTVLGEAERFGAVFANGAGVVEVLSDDGRAAGVVCVDAESGERFEVRADNVVNATGVWADRIRPEEILTEEEVPRIAPSRGTHVTISQDLLPVGRAACIVPAGEERTIFALPWYGRALVGTTDRDYEGDIARVQPSGEDIEYLLDAANSFFGTDIGPRRPDGRVRRRPAADLDRRPAQVGGHLPQGRALRDLVGAAHDHGRQAHDLAPDGEAGRRPDGRARGPRGAVPDGGDPARDAGRRRGPDAARGRGGSGPPGRMARSPGVPLRPRRRAGSSRSPPSAPSSRARSFPGQPDLLAEAAIAARLEQARSVADVLLRRTRLGLVAAPQLRTAESVTPVAEAMAGELGWDGRRVRREAEGWLEAAAAEGIDPATGLSRRPLDILPPPWRRGSKTFISPTCTPARRSSGCPGTGCCAATSSWRRSPSATARRPAEAEEGPRPASRRSARREAKPERERLEEAETEDVVGVLEVTPQRYGFLRFGGLEAQTDDVYVSASQIRRCELRSGDEVGGPARAPRRGERHRALVHVDRVNGGEPPTEERPAFDDLTPVLPSGGCPWASRATSWLAPSTC